MGFEPTSLPDLAGRSNHWATGHSMVGKSETEFGSLTTSHGHTAN